MAVVVLFFRGLEQRDWRLSALLVLDGDGPPPVLELAEAGHPITACHLASRLGRSLWRYDFCVPLAAAERTVDYRIGGGSWRVHLPALGGPLRIAFTACNGYEDERTGCAGAGRNRLWRKLEAEHARAPFHLLLQGGDQLYADSVWHEVPALAAWRRLPLAPAGGDPFTPAMAEAVADYYFGRYCWLWEQPELARIMPAVPSLMMWDDHDIFDGWGSHDPMAGLPRVPGDLCGRGRAFALFQLAGAAALPGGLRRPRRPVRLSFRCWRHRHHRARSALGAQPGAGHGRGGLARVRAMLEGLAGCRHLLLLSSVPLLNADSPSSGLEALPGQQYFQLDMRDQWRSIFHREEWLRLLRHLFAFSARTGRASPRSRARSISAPSRSRSTPGQDLPADLVGHRAPAAAGAARRFPRLDEHWPGRRDRARAQARGPEDTRLRQALSRRAQLAGARGVGDRFRLVGHMAHGGSGVPLPGRVELSARRYRMPRAAPGALCRCRAHNL